MNAGLGTPLPGSLQGVRSEMALLYAICHLAGVSICTSKTSPSITVPSSIKIEKSTPFRDVLVEQRRPKRPAFISCVHDSNGNTEIVSATENPLVESRANSMLNAEAFVGKLRDLMVVVENLLEDMMSTRRSRRTSRETCYIDDGSATDISDGGSLTKQQLADTLSGISSTLSKCVLYANVVKESEQHLQRNYEGISRADYARFIREQIQEHHSHGLRSLICELDLAVYSMSERISENIHNHDVPSSGRTRSQIFDTNQNLVCEMVKMLNEVVSRMTPIISRIRHL
ncbi:hypothetical protein CAPTEDRAFT_187394 [Capitella teleta]|uniref:Uncharacterized protein n=1 Tax=Capitella teleta TaxID=283909 RepID=R7TRV2_CAPTE|nr:hypothetical protein CAPTEDRAFT_187394 [Capitella teleta]|eukprot:ELT96658.1 hypothetical protein CAPTEDRAFT_187394 [Capitella teleta]